MRAVAAGGTTPLGAPGRGPRAAAIASTPAAMSAAPPDSIAARASPERRRGGSRSPERTSPSASRSSTALERGPFAGRARRTGR